MPLIQVGLAELDGSQDPGLATGWAHINCTFRFPHSILAQLEPCARCNSRHLGSPDTRLPRMAGFDCPQTPFIDNQIYRIP
jgi:hypothetical protein